MAAGPTVHQRHHRKTLVADDVLANHNRGVVIRHGLEPARRLVDAIVAGLVLGQNPYATVDRSARHFQGLGGPDAPAGRAGREHVQERGADSRAPAGFGTRLPDEMWRQHELLRGRLLKWKRARFAAYFR